MSEDDAPNRWLTGCYTTDGGGSGKGVGLLEYHDGTLATFGVLAESPSPSFLARHPRLAVVYAVAEFEGGVRAFSVDGDRMSQLGDAVPIGGGPCHIAVDPAGRYVVVSCYGEGRVVAIPLDGDGRLTEAGETEPSADPTGAGRQSRAHFALPLDDDRLLTSDLGHDTVRQWRWDGASLVMAADPVVLPPGSGPRHLALHPSGRVLVITEYSIEVAALEATGDGFALAWVGPATAAGRQDGDAGATITVTADGRFAHVTVRGSNTVATLTCADGVPRPIADTPCGGDWPRDHAQAGDLLLVANQLSDEVAAFRLDATGIPTLLGTTPVDSPTCILAASTG